MSKQSRFFATGNESSESSESESDDNVEERKVPARFARANASSDSEPEVEQKRVVRSQKEKQLDELNKTIKSLRTAMSINDWNKIQDDFDLLNKQIAKATAVTQQGVPRFYIKMLADLEEFHKKMMENKEAKKKMSPTNARSLNSMKNKLKKHNKQYEKEIETYLKNPDESEGEGEKEEESEEESEEEESGEEMPTAAPSKQPQTTKTTTTTKTTKPAPTEESESEGEGTEEEKSASEDESSSEDENYRRTMEAEKNKKNKWLASKEDKPAAPAKIQKPNKGDKITKPTKAAGKAKEETGAASVQGEKEQELTPEQIDQKLKEIGDMRGRKKTNRQEQIAILKSLAKKAKTPDRQLMVYLQLVSSIFDLSQGLTIMPVANWKKCHKYTTRILNILNENPSMRLQEGGEQQTLSRQTEHKEEQNEDGEQTLHIEGNLLAFVERLHDEFIKSLIDPAFIDPHTHAYLLRLQDETVLMELASGVQQYYERIGKIPSAARVAGVRVEHIYYKLDQPKKKEGDKPEAKPESSDAKYETRALLNKLAHFIYLHADQRLRSRTILCQIYYEALHDRFYEARDLMLMSHLQDDVQHMDLPTQILFNRTMVQLGLCAFRNGLIQEAHSSLSEIGQAGARVKELLAQGVASRYGDKEQDKAALRRQVPYHMHINLELLECVHLISAMLLEIPNMAANSFDPKKKVISRTFRRLYDQFERAIFNGPPENARETVMTAAKALAKGDWKKCETLLLSLNVWNLLQNTDQVKAMLRRKIQEEGLRTYLFTFSGIYDSISLDELWEMFELPKNNVHSLVSKMMIHEELRASWDQPSSSIVLHRVEPTKLQYLALQFAEKAANFVENNERLLDTLTGGYGYKETKQPQGKERWQDQENRQHRYPPRTYQQNRGRQQQYHNYRSQQQDHYQQHRKGLADSGSLYNRA